jgi:uncharacterized NAD-dependent epimerase/dehydratase family protein
VKAAAVVLCPGLLRTPNGKTAHGLIRGGERFEVVALLDETCAGRDAGEVLDGKKRGIPIVASLAEALTLPGPKIEWCVVGVATHGGALTPPIRALLREAARAGLSLVNGLHEFAGDDPDIRDALARTGARVVDVRRPKPKNEMRFWTGEVANLPAPRLAVLGMDCAIGKRTTARMLVEEAGRAGIRAEMISTGQTGWMQGARFGIVLDSIPNDFVSGELEGAILECHRTLRPDLLVLEGQSSLRNPSGPCGAELLLSAAARGAILQHAPARKFFDGYEGRFPIPTIESEIELVASYGARTLAVALNGAGLSAADLAREAERLAAKLGIPVVRPLEEGVGALVPVLRRFLEEERR